MLRTLAFAKASAGNNDINDAVLMNPAFAKASAGKSV